ncbi:MAG: hypothetical protein EF813_11200 [Methanosarcinales archaeon]|nr:MAG: hypothetical protein EF813_11200 [Methanosarcinales archaeon]
MYNTKQHICIIVTIVSASISCCCAPVSAWSNGGYSDNPGDVQYGTHDWIAEHALDFLPPTERQYIDNNLNWYLYGTELPDNSRPDDGIGDTSRHHVYFYENGSLMDDASATRAQDIYNNTIAFLKTGDQVNASKYAGIMTHYIADVAVFGHVMGKKTDWDAEVHHGDYESYVRRRTGSNASEAFDPYIRFDGTLEIVTAYNATIYVANDTTFDAESEGHGCTWMDSHYNWSNPEFRDECGESLNLATNAIADVLHTLYNEACSEQRGDLNGDGRITPADAAITLRMAVNGEYSDNADINRDSSITSLDALMILQDVETG